MSRKNGYRLSTMIFGLAVCLTLPACRTCQEKGRAADEVSASSAAASDTIRKLNEIIIPEMTFFPPATIVDAVDFLKQASREYDKSGAPPDKRGVSFVVNLPRVPMPMQGDRETVDPFAEVAFTNQVVSISAAISVRAISLYDALQLVCDVTEMRWHVSEKGTVMLRPAVMWGDEDWVTRSYRVPPALSECLFNSSGATADPNKVWHAFFEQLGVTGPDFAECEYLSAINTLRVTNTPENLAIIDQIFDMFALRMVEVEMQIHAFRIKDIERLRLAGGVSLESLMALREQGKSKPIATATSLTKSGQETIMKAVREVLYPTDVVKDSGQSGSNVTSRTAANVLMPCNFDVRETGMVLQVVPEVSPAGGLIDLMLNPRWVTLDGWESYPANLSTGWTSKTLPFRQPVFGVTVFQTQVSVADGRSVLLGSCSTPDGEWVQVGFLTARLRDVQPRTAGVSFGKSTRRVTRTINAEHRVPNVEVEPQSEQRGLSVAQKMRDIVIPEVTFRPPATIVDAVRFFKEASVTCDKSDVPKEQRGVDFVLKLQTTAGDQAESGATADPFAPVSFPVAKDGVPVISALSARFINLYDALKLVCDVTGMKFRVKDGIVWIVPENEPDSELVMRIYPSPISLVDDLRVNGAKRLFQMMGVRWPVGSSVTNMDVVGKLRVTNTRENLAVFEQVLDDLTVQPSLVEVEMQIHAFRSEDIERLRLSGDVSAESLMALRKRGRSEPVASASVLTKSGAETVVKCVREVLYPTELGLGGGAESVTPSNFEKREVGMILHVVPEISSDDPVLINLMLNPQWITLGRWASYPSAVTSGWATKTLPLRQPVFGVTSFQGQVTVRDGGTVLLGNSATPDGKWVHVGFLTAKRLNAQSAAAVNSP